MTDLPDYSSVEPPAEEAPESYDHHARRADILRRIREAGSPFAINQARLADRYDVHESTISRDMDRLRESIDSHLGQDAKLLTRTLLETTVRELHAEGEWKAAWDVVMDWNDWLADVGEQEREPDQLDVEMDARATEVSYTIVREAPDLPTDEEGGVDYDDLGFTQAPGGEVSVEEVDNDE